MEGPARGCIRGWVHIRVRAGDYAWELPRSGASKRGLEEGPPRLMLVAMRGRHARLWGGARHGSDVQRDFSIPGTGRGDRKACSVYFVLRT